MISQTPTQTTEQLPATGPHPDALALATAKLSGTLARFLESENSIWGSYVDPREAYRGPDGELWNQVGGGAPGGGPFDQPLFQTTNELQMIRAWGEWLWRHSGIAKSFHRNRQNFIVGWGHTYKVTGRTADTPEESITAVQGWLDEWIKVNKWQRHQREWIERWDKHGDVFRRYFPGDDGMMLVRFVEPANVRPPDQAKPNESFGIRTDPDDIVTVEDYYVVDPSGKGEWVDAAKMQHAKNNVDSGTKRGIPTLWPVRHNCRRADKILVNMSMSVQIQTAIAMIRKWKNATQEVVRSFVNDQQIASEKDAANRTRSILQYGPGSIIDGDMGKEYEFPAQGIDPSKSTHALQAECRIIGASVCMPEYMISADASNANFSSTLIAESPAVKNFEAEQQSQIEFDLEVINAAMGYAVDQGVLTAADVAAITVEAEGPAIVTRDRLQEAQVRQIDMATGTLSPQTACTEAGRDYETEQDNIEAHVERTGGLPGMPNLGAGLPAIPGMGAAQGV